MGLRKLRQFQDLGHTVVFLIGDYHGMIGDPSGRSDTRKRSDREVLIENAKHIHRAGLQDPRPETHHRRRLQQPLAGAPRVRRCPAPDRHPDGGADAERDDFEKRYEQGRPAHQSSGVRISAGTGLDDSSVALNADVEIGATEQKFNLLMAREIHAPTGGNRKPSSRCPS